MSKLHVFSVNLRNAVDYKLSMHGRDEHGNYVSVDVDDFNHYFYIGVRKSFSYPSSAIDIATKLQSVYKSAYRKFVNKITPVLVRGDFRRYNGPRTDFNLKSIYGYKLDDDPDKYLNVYKIYVTRQCDIRRLEWLIDAQFNKGREHKPVEIFETKVDWITRFMADIQLDGSSWITTNGRRTIPTARIRQIDGCADVSRYRICSIDIECVSQDGTFPIPERDPIVQIAIVFAHQDTGSGGLIVTRRLIISLGVCDKPINATLGIDRLEFDDERALISAFADEIVVYMSPSSLDTYNLSCTNEYVPSISPGLRTSPSKVCSRSPAEYTNTDVHTSPVKCVSPIVEAIAFDNAYTPPPVKCISSIAEPVSFDNTYNSPVKCISPIAEAISFDNAYTPNVGGSTFHTDFDSPDIEMTIPASYDGAAAYNVEKSTPPTCDNNNTNIINNNTSSVHHSPGRCVENQLAEYQTTIKDDGNQGNNPPNDINVCRP